MWWDKKKWGSDGGSYEDATSEVYSTYLSHVDCRKLNEEGKTEGKTKMVYIPAR